MSAIFRVIDNDPKGERNGTVFGGSYKGVTVVWTVFQELNRDSQYLKWLELVEQSKRDAEILSQELEVISKQNKEKALRERLVPLTEQQKTLVESFLDVSFKKEDKKVFNFTVGKLLGIFKKQNLNIDPFSLSEYLKNR